MTYEQAVAFLQEVNMALRAKRRFGDLEETKQHFQYRGEVETIIDAIKRQIPRQPKAIQTSELKWDIRLHCPECGKPILYENFCANCGHALGVWRWAKQ